MSGFNRPNMEVKRKIFISYHHFYDQYYKDFLSNTLSEKYDICTDNSIEEPIDSDNIDYLKWKIKNEHIKGTSVTIVLCGSDTYKRKWIDWEIKYTLEMEHALIGLYLPNATRNLNGNIIVPDRLYHNIKSGYAKFAPYSTSDAIALKALIENAISHSKGNQNLIINNMPLKARNDS